MEIQISNNWAKATSTDIFHIFLAVCQRMFLLWSNMYRIVIVLDNV